MAVSCNCSEYDIMSVGDPHEVTCRTPNTCCACETVINPGDKMYRQSFYDFDQCLTVAPAWLCEECGDMALNLIDQEYCFDFSGSIKQQWLDYLYDTEPNNPAVRR